MCKELDEVKKNKDAKAQNSTWQFPHLSVADETSPGSRWRSLREIVERAKVRRWQATQFSKGFLTFSGARHLGVSGWGFLSHGAGLAGWQNASFFLNMYVWSLAKISWVQAPAPQQGALPPQSYGEMVHSWGWESSVGGDPCWGNALGNNTLLRTSHLGDILHGRKTCFPALLSSHYFVPANRYR